MDRARKRGSVVTARSRGQSVAEGRVAPAATEADPMPAGYARPTLLSRLRASLVQGAFMPGEQLFEVRLAGQFATSRGPVREALYQLVAEGLLREEPNRGVFVISCDGETVSDLYFARQVVEEAAALKVATMGRASLLPLRRKLARIERATKDRSWARAVDADLSFHEELVRASGSDHLVRMFRTLSATARMSLLWLEPLYPNPDDLDVEHKLIVDAIASMDATVIRQQVELHMREALRRLALEPEFRASSQEPRLRCGRGPRPQ